LTNYFIEVLSDYVLTNEHSARPRHSPPYTGVFVVGFVRNTSKPKTQRPLTRGVFLFWGRLYKKHKHVWKYTKDIENIDQPANAANAAIIAMAEAASAKSEGAIAGGATDKYV
jgi:hypothetical protein